MEKSPTEKLSDKVCRCVNLDWLEVYLHEDMALFPCNAEFFRAQGWSVLEREYGTRQYKEMFTLFSVDGHPLYEIRRAPASEQGRDGGLFPPNSCHLRLSNYACYMADPIGLLRQFLLRYKYHYQKIFRIDIALDFVQFDSGDKPEDFVRRYMRGKYSKLNQANLAAHGTDTWSGRCWNSLSWGQPKSMVSTKMYCKTLELEQVRDKPYIRHAWFLAGLIDDPLTGIKVKADGTRYKPDVWRVEFSIKASAKHWFVVEQTSRKNKRIGMPHSLDVYDTPQKLLTMWANLADHYFHFKHYQDGVRKDRCPDKQLFTFGARDTFYKLGHAISSQPKNTDVDRLIMRLQEYREHVVERHILEAIDTIISALNRKRMRDYTARSEDWEAVGKMISERLHGFEELPINDHLKLIHDTLELFRHPQPAQ